ncbi:MAG: carboxypeptidase regulatory-like domain-containing protein, partial [Gemmatimonadota bacterium]
AWDAPRTPTVVARQPPDRIPAPRQVIRGRLLDAETERAIEDAMIVVEQLDDDSVVVVDTLEGNRRGGFVANLRSPGDYRLQVDADGYASAVSEWFRIQAGGAIEAEIRMRPRAIQIEGVTVSVEARRLRLERMGFYDRARSTTGTFITVDDIERRNPRVASDMLRSLPSVRVADGPHGRGAVYMRSGERAGGQGGLKICWPRILLDGYVVFPGGELGPGDAPPLIDDLVAPTDVEGIEVYRDAAEMPAQYGGANSACGVIVIWTRAGGGG